MEKIPASAGWLWVKQGFALFRKQPGGLAVLFVAYLFLMIALSVLPVLGQVALVVLTPVFFIAFLEAYRAIDENRRIEPGLLAKGFHKPTLMPLLGLGLLYLAVNMMAVGVLMAMDEGVVWKLASRQIQPTAEVAERIRNVLLTVAAVCAPVGLAFAFTAPLVYWKGMSLGKSMFFSVYSVWHAIKAFLVFGLAWIGIWMLCSSLLTLLIFVSQLSALLIFPLMITFFLALMGSLYAAYRQLFGSPAAAPA